MKIFNRVHDEAIVTIKILKAVIQDCLIAVVKKLSS